MYFRRLKALDGSRPVWTKVWKYGAICGEIIPNYFDWIKLIKIARGKGHVLKMSIWCICETRIAGCRQTPQKKKNGMEDGLGESRPFLLLRGLNASVLLFLLS